MKFGTLGHIIASASVLLGVTFASEAKAQNLRIEEFRAPSNEFIYTIDENSNSPFNENRDVPDTVENNNIELNTRDNSRNDYIPNVNTIQRTRDRQPINSQPIVRPRRASTVQTRNTIVEVGVESSAAALGGKIVSDIAAGRDWNVGGSAGITYYSDANNGAEFDVDLGIYGTYSISSRFDINAAIDVTARNQDQLEAIRVLTLNPEYIVDSNRNNDIVVGGELVNHSGGIDAYQDFNRSNIYVSYITRKLRATASAYPFIGSASFDGTYEIQDSTTLNAYVETSHTADTIDVDTQFDANITQNIADNVFTRNDVIKLRGGYRNGVESLGNNVVSNGIYIGGTYTVEL